MEFLGSAELLRFDGTKVKAKDALADKKVVAFYFSAHWCPPCRAFTPVLKKFYEDVSKDSELEVIFVSSDHSAEDMMSYITESHGHWLAVEHGSTVAQNIEKKYDVSGIPTLVVIRKSDGEIITPDGVEAVQEKGNLAVKDWH